MNRNRLATTAAFLLAFASMANAEFGVGFNFGAPTGLNLRVGKDRTLEATAGWNFKNEGTNLELLGDVLFHGASVFRSSPLNGVVPYAGAGIGFWMWDANEGEDKAGIWLEVPLGIDLRFSIPLELSLHIDPGVDVIPQTKATIHWGLGIRYWLK